MICPKLDGKKIKLNGSTSEDDAKDENTQQGKAFYLQVAKCSEDNKTVKECADEEEIKKFVNQLTVNTFGFVDQINWK